MLLEMLNQKDKRIPLSKKNADISKENQGTRDSYSVARFQLLILATRVNGRNIRDSYTSQKRGNRQYVNTRFQLLFSQLARYFTMDFDGHPT